MGSNRIAYALCSFHALAVYVLLIIGSGTSAVWWDDGSAVMALWATSPHLVLLGAIMWMGSGAGRGLAALLLGLLSGGGLAILAWGLVLDPGDYNHLIVFFLPIHQFGLLLVCALGAAAVYLVRGAYVR